MAHTKSAKKHLRQDRKRRLLNKSKRSEAKTRIKYVLNAVAAKEIKKAEEELSLAFKKIDKCAKSNVFHPNKAARLKSRLARQVDSLKRSSAVESSK
jgi:small subunit ribosomal protein S20